MQIGTHNEQTGQKAVFVAGFAGILAGAAGVTALALSDREIRKKVSKKAQELKSTLQEWSAEKLQIIDIQEQKHKANAAPAERVIDNTDNTKVNEPLEEAENAKN